MDLQGLISWTKFATKLGDRIGDQLVMLVLYHWIGKLLALIKGYVLMPIWFFLRNYPRESEELRTQFENMRNVELELRRLVDRAKRDHETVLPRAQRWLDGVDQIRNYSRNRWKFLWKRIMHAKEIKAAVDKLILQGRSIDRVSISQSKMLIFHEIVKAFTDNLIIRIGLNGERGAGTTSLIEEIVKEAVDTGLFKEVVTVASSNQTMIIDEIADQLGLTIPKMYTEEGRAKWLSKILEEKTSILVILHNVQAVVRWAEAGIPNREFRCNGCKILLVSQNEDVCLDSGVKKESNFPIN